MIALYNLCQFLLLALFWPLLLAVALLKEKYRATLPVRLGIGLDRLLPAGPAAGKTVWVHALSVGEVSSARPLVIGLRRTFPAGRIIFSTTTATGMLTARTLLAEHVDAILPFPLDLRPVISRYLRKLQPDLFILVETDFWPNMLTMLNGAGVPSILVNGRISARSFSRYRSAQPFVQHLFRSFTHLCMQTEADRNNMERFGVDPGRLHCLGNLKFDAQPATSGDGVCSQPVPVPPDSVVFIAGSTHEGEEDSIFSMYTELKKRHPNLYLVIAPRNPVRSRELAAEAASRHHLVAAFRSAGLSDPADFLLIDTLGELPWLYGQADIAFVGGSMVEKGGHNPIEPASQGIPVLFGRHMEDFSEISRDLLLAGGALTVTDQSALEAAIESLITSKERRQAIGRQARAVVDRQRGVVNRHLHIIRPYL
jgi:3-deoxy-D-manno-octulosonic-acid transferase